MKIHGPNMMNIQKYKNQTFKKTVLNEKNNQNDKLNISEKAKQLQVNGKVDVKRTNYIQQIKQAVESGNYKMNPERTAQKMIEFWSKQK